MRLESFQAFTDSFSISFWFKTYNISIVNQTLFSQDHLGDGYGVGLSYNLISSSFEYGSLTSWMYDKN